MSSKLRFRGRFVVELPILNVCGKRSIIVGDKLITVDPPQLEEAIVRYGQAVSLVPINNVLPCHREQGSQSGGVPLGTPKTRGKHDASPENGRKTPSRILAFSQNLVETDCFVPVETHPIRGLWKKSGVLNRK